MYFFLLFWFIKTTATRLTNSLIKVDLHICFRVGAQEPWR